MLWFWIQKRILETCYKGGDIVLTIEDMFATKAEAINSYQQDIKKLMKDLRQKVDEILLLRKALREITETKIPLYWKISTEAGRIKVVTDIWITCCKTLKDTQRYELLEECLEEVKENA